MPTCPLCQRDADLIVTERFLQRDMIELARNISDTWERSDGMCTECFYSLLHTTAVLADWAAGGRQPSANFNEYHRYTLTKHEHGLWHHVNTNMQPQRRKQIVERINDEAYRAGYALWVLFDTNETMIAQGVVDANLGT